LAWLAELLIVFNTSLTYALPILTIIESLLFTKLWPDYWTED